MSKAQKNKLWTYKEHEFALDSAWTAFNNTLKAHGVTQAEIDKFKYLADGAIYKVSDYFGQSITWKEE